MEMKNNVIPFSRGHEIRGEREEEILSVETSFAMALELYASEGRGMQALRKWVFDVQRMITMLCRQPNEINKARMDLIADLLEESKGSKNFLRDLGDERRAALYEKGEESLLTALDFYWKKNDGKLPLGKTSSQM